MAGTEHMMRNDLKKERGIESRRERKLLTFEDSHVMDADYALKSLRSVPG